MSEAVPILLLLLVMTAGCWILVFSQRARDSIQRPAWRLYRLNEEQRELWNAVYFAAVLILALAFTLFLAVALVAALRAN